MHQTYTSTYLAILHQVFEVVCFLVSLLLDHVYPSSGLSLNKVNLVKPVHTSDNSLCPSAFQQSSIGFSNNTSIDVYVALVTSMYFTGKGNISSFSMYSLTLGST